MKRDHKIFVSGMGAGCSIVFLDLTLTTFFIKGDLFATAAYLSALLVFLIIMFKYFPIKFLGDADIREVFDND